VLIWSLLWNMFDEHILCEADHGHFQDEMQPAG